MAWFALILIWQGVIRAGSIGHLKIIPRFRLEWEVEYLAPSSNEGYDCVSSTTYEFEEGQVDLGRVILAHREIIFNWLVSLFICLLNSIVYKRLISWLNNVEWKNNLNPVISG